MSQLISKPDLTYSVGEASLQGVQSQEPLPPYELDPALDKSGARKRIGEVIAKAMERRLPRR